MCDVELQGAIAAMGHPAWTVAGPYPWLGRMLVADIARQGADGTRVGVQGLATDELVMADNSLGAVAS